MIGRCDLLLRSCDDTAAATATAVVAATAAAASDNQVVNEKAQVQCQ
jgi:hypothetical protein